VLPKYIKPCHLSLFVVLDTHVNDNDRLYTGCGAVTDISGYVFAGAVLAITFFEHGSIPFSIGVSTKAG
jgi:hypothetical protein